MDVVLVINQLHVGTLPIAILTGAREVVQLYVLDLVEILRLVTSCSSESF